MAGQRQENSKSDEVPARSTLGERWRSFWAHPRTRSTVRHPLFPMAVLIAVCLIVEENYPFSDFPMYSSLSPGSHYFHLTDENDQPLPIKALFGISASEFKKIYHSKLTPMAVQLSEERGQRIRASDLGPAEQATAGDQLLDQLMPRTEGRKWWKENQPTELRLIRTDIHRNDKALSETPRQITVRKLSNHATTRQTGGASSPLRADELPAFSALTLTPTAAGDAHHPTLDGSVRTLRPAYSLQRDSRPANRTPNTEQGTPHLKVSKLQTPLASSHFNIRNSAFDVRCSNSPAA